MKLKEFTPLEMEILSQNPNVERISPYTITYTKEFKERVLKAELAKIKARSNPAKPKAKETKAKISKTATKAKTKYTGGLKVFQDAGFDLEFLTLLRVRGSINNWMKAYRDHGMPGLDDGRAKWRNESSHNLQSKEIERLQIIIEFYKEKEVVNNHLFENGLYHNKKARNKAIFTLIEELSEKYGKGYVLHFCSEADVSRRGYYRYLKANNKLVDTEMEALLQKEA